jgi:arylsulfatase A-like enzyme
VVGDALRHDALRMRYDDRPTPFTERIASWINFDRCYATAPWTLPAMRGIMTGVDSTQSRMESAWHEAPPASLIGRFDRHHRAAFVNNSVIKRPDLSAGFDQFQLIDDHADTFTDSRHYLAGRAADAAPFFLYVHSNLVHDYPQKTARAHFDRWFPSSPFPEIGPRVLSWPGLTRQSEAVRRVYDACALTFHEEVEALLDVTPLDRTIVIVIADHGEGMEPAIARIHHGGRMHDDVLRVPLTIYIPEAATGSERHSRLVSSAHQPFSAVELLPVLLDLTGYADDTGPVDRVSPPIPGSHRVLRAEDPKYLYLANRFRLNSNPRGKHTTLRQRAINKAWRSTLSHSTLLQAFIEWPYKLIVTRMEATSALVARLGRQWQRRYHRGHPVSIVKGRVWFGFEVYDLARDPAEATNLLPHRQGIAEDALRLVDQLEKGGSDQSIGSLLRSSPR